MRRADRQAFRLTYAAWLFGLFAYFMPAATWNPVSHFNLTRAIVEGGRYRFNSFASSTGDRALVKPATGTRTRRPSLPSSRCPLTACSGSSSAFAASRRRTERWARRTRRRFSLTSERGVSAGPVRLLAVHERHRGGRARPARASSCSVGGPRYGGRSWARRSRVVATPILPYSTSFYGHVPAAAFLLAAIVCLDTRGKRFGGGLLPHGACARLGRAWCSRQAPNTWSWFPRRSWRCGSRR